MRCKGDYLDTNLDLLRKWLFIPIITSDRKYIVLHVSSKRQPDRYKSLSPAGLPR